MTERRNSVRIQSETPTPAGPRFAKTCWRLSWMAGACQLSGSAAQVAVALLHRASTLGQRGFQLNRQVAETFGLSPDSVSRGLRELEQAKLVDIMRRPGRRPIITLRDADARAK